MNMISGRNAHELLPILVDLVMKRGVLENTRNGEALRLHGPTLVCYEQPTERVVFWPERDCNPFFHFMESLWMLAGRNDVAFVEKFAKRMRQYSDDGETFNGAYGYRWRRHFGYDQIEWIVDAIQNNKADRRLVLQMWDAGDFEGAEMNGDLYLGQNGCADVPCNTQAYFLVTNGKLDMTVCNRSNDLIWGMLGANAVHFSVLQEYIANKAGIPVGKYYQFSNNLHAYTATLEPLKELPRMSGMINTYEDWSKIVKPLRLEVSGAEGEKFDEDLNSLDLGENCSFNSFYFQCVVKPIFAVWNLYKEDRLDLAIENCRRIAADDWRIACKEWLERRVKRRQEKRLQYAQDNGVIYQ